MAQDKDLAFIRPSDDPATLRGDDTLFAAEVSAYESGDVEDAPVSKWSALEDLELRRFDLALKDRELTEQAEDRRLEREMRQGHHDQLMAMIGDLRDARKKYASNIFWMVVIWLIAVCVILCLQGASKWTGFELSEKVVLALIGGTTLNVLGIFTIVAKFLFPSKGSLLPDFVTTSHNGESKSTRGKDAKSRSYSAKPQKQRGKKAKPKGQ